MARRRQSIEARALLDHPENPGAVDRAVDLLERATGRDPQFALAHAALATAYLARFAANRDATLVGRADSAAKRAVQLDPEGSVALTALATVQNQYGNRDAALTTLRHAIDLQPDNDEAHRLLGEITAARGNVDGGVAEIRTAVQLRPSFNHYYKLGFVLLTASRYAAALDAYERAAELRPNHGGAYEMLGATHQYLGHLDQAIGNYEHAIRVGPTATAFSNLAMLYYQAGSYEKARTAVLAALARNPKKHRFTAQWAIYV